MTKVNSPTAIHKIWHRVKAVYDKSPPPAKPAPPEAEKLKSKVGKGLLELKNQGVELTSARTQATNAPASAAPQPGEMVNTRTGEFLQQRKRVHDKMLRLCQLLKKNHQHEDAKRFPKYFQRVKELTASVGALDPTDTEFDTQHEANEGDLDGMDVTGVEQALDGPDLATAAMDDEEDEMAAGPSGSARTSDEKDEMAAGPSVRASVAAGSRPTPVQVPPASQSESQALQEKFKKLLPEARTCEHHPIAGAKVSALIPEILHHFEHHETGPAAKKLDMLALLVSKVPHDQRIRHSGVDNVKPFITKEEETFRQHEKEQAEQMLQKEQKAKESRQNWQKQVEGLEKKLQERGVQNADVADRLEQVHARIARDEEPTSELHELQIFLKAAMPELKPEEYRRRLAEIPLPEGEVGATVLNRLKMDREEIRSVIERGNDDPELLLISLRRNTVAARDAYARRHEFQRLLDDDFLPKGLPPDRLAKLVEMRDDIGSLIDQGMNPEELINLLKTEVKEIKANQAQEDKFIYRLARIPSPKGMTGPQAVDLEELRTEISTAIAGGENADGLLDLLEARIRKLEEVNARRQEFEARLAAIPKPGGTLSEAQTKLVKEQRDGIQEAIDRGYNPEQMLDELQKRVPEIEAVNAKRAEWEKELASLQDPPRPSEREATELKELRTQITTSLDLGVDPSYLLAHLRSRIEETQTAIESRQKDKGRLEHIADAQGKWRQRLEEKGANPGQLARVLRLRRHIEFVIEEEGDASVFLERLNEEVNGFDKINSDRQKWEEELQAIPIPSGLPQDQLATWEELRQQTRIQIDEATNPADIRKNLRQLAGVN